MNSHPDTSTEFSEDPKPRDQEPSTRASVRAATTAQRPSQRCSARSSRTGEPCKRYAILGGTVCPTHGGSAPQVREAARRRIDALVPLAINTLGEVAGEGDNEAARVRAAQEILKVAGIQAPSERDEFFAQPNPELDALITKALHERFGEPET